MGGILNEGFFVYGSKTDGDANETFGSKPGTWVHVHDAYFGEDEQMAVDAASEYGERREGAVDLDVSGAKKIGELGGAGEHIQGKPDAIRDTIEGGPDPGETSNNGRISYTPYKATKLPSHDAKKPDTLRTTRYQP